MIIGTVRPEEAKVFDSDAGYHPFHAPVSILPSNGETFGCFEVYWNDGFTSEDETLEPGWYWASGFPGCLWDSEPVGPFASSTQAMLDADEYHPDYIDD
jgi:hypothetical protein